VTTQQLSAIGRPTTYGKAITSPPGREGLFELIKSMPSAFKYESGMIVAEKALLYDVMITD
jgi:hypothetical protein